MISTLESWLLAVALAMDCFSVSLASGAILRKIYLRQLLTMSFFFGLFQAIMPFFGWALSNRFLSYIVHIDHWIAFALLCYLGVRMIREDFKEEEAKSFNPMQLKVIFTLAIATSIDALAIGVSFSCAGVTTLKQLVTPLVIIGFVSFLFSIMGQLIGVHFGRRYKFRAELLGGIVLICIGVKVLLSHLFEW